MSSRSTHLQRGIQLAAIALLVLLPVACSNQGAPNGPNSVSSAPAPPAPAPASGPTDAEVQSLVNLVNSHRTSMGRASLIWDDRVAAVALAHSQDMVDNHYYGHIDLEGRDAGERLNDAGISWSYWGENYCYGFSTASSAYNFWINSAPHRANLESANCTHHGIGKVGSVWTHVFLKPRTVTGVETP